MHVSVRCEHHCTILHNPFLLDSIGLGVGQYEHALCRIVHTAETDALNTDIPIGYSAYFIGVSLDRCECAITLG